MTDPAPTRRPLHYPPTPDQDRDAEMESGERRLWKRVLGEAFFDLEHATGLDFASARRFLLEDAALIGQATGREPSRIRERADAILARRREGGWRRRRRSRRKLFPGHDASRRAQQAHGQAKKDRDARLRRRFDAGEPIEKLAEAFGLTLWYAKAIAERRR